MAQLDGSSKPPLSVIVIWGRVTFRLGPDDPATVESDVIGRVDVARSIASLIRATPEDWTVRIGVYGHWGDGKTSVMRLVESLVVKESMVCVRFNPSLIGDRLQVWNHLIVAITRALESPSSTLNPMARASWYLTRVRAWAASWRHFRLGLEVANAVQEKPSIGSALMDIAARAANTIQRGMLAKRKHLESLIKEHLGTRRLVLFVDDLDRTDPTLVPHVLLGIREIAVPRCAIVVAIDPTLVTKTLEHVNPAWGSGVEFVSKILQYHFWLTPPDQRQMQALATSESTLQELGVPLSTVVDVLDLLPQNPRRFKEFLRSLGRLRDVLRRHDDDEVDWQLILMLEVLRARHPVVTDLLLRSESFRSELSSSMFLEKLEDNDKYTERIQQKLTGAISELSGDRVIGKEATEELVELVREVGRRAEITSADSVRYWGTIHTSPPAITRRELKRILLEWRNSERTPDGLDELLAAHAAAVEKGRRQVSAEFYASLLRKRREELAEASSSDTEPEMAEWLQLAEGSFEVLRVFVVGCHAFANDTYGLSSDDLVGLYEHCAEWAHFRNTTDYVRFRDAEREMLLQAALDARAMASAVITQLSAMGWASWKQ
jgi:hypothetical protein